tara:strand:+ start:37515 stop:38000 length:486 start_codon:yes stop_codon:yes gene_type:complete
MQKKCFKCEEVKPLECFYKHSGMADGRLNKCKNCNKKDVSKNYRANIDHYKEYEKARAGLPHRVDARKDYSLTEEGKKTGNKAKREWTARNPIKRMASQIVNNAVRNGTIKKQDHCESCKAVPIRLHGHHDDYAYPLVVQWLCPGCHNKWHKINGEGLNAT